MDVKIARSWASHPHTCNLLPLMILRHMLYTNLSETCQYIASDHDAAKYCVYPNSSDFVNCSSVPLCGCGALEREFLFLPLDI